MTPDSVDDLERVRNLARAVVSAGLPAPKPSEVLAALPPDANLRILDISTVHIPRRTMIALGEDEATCRVADLWNVLVYTPWADFGWIISVPDDPPEDIYEPDTVRTHRELMDLLRLCQCLNVRFLKLDGDAPRVPGLPKFDWEVE